MTKRERIQDEVQKTISFLDKMPRLDGNPFLYTRIALQLNAGAGRSSARAGHRLAAVFSTVLLALLIIFNIMTLAHSLTGAAGDTVSRSDLKETIVQEYQIGVDPRAQLIMTETR